MRFNHRSALIAVVSTATSLVFSWMPPGLAIARAGEVPPENQTTTFVVLSDVHYGITRSQFRGEWMVDAQRVNAALIEKLNHLPQAILPGDDGLQAARPVGAIDFVAITGDLTNRQEIHPVRIQSAALSWEQFAAGYIRSLTLKDHSGRPTPLLLVPGNHDVSNAIGYPGMPSTDATPMARIYNRMMQPATPLTPENYNYALAKINYSRDFGGVHCIFVTMWPDAGERAWIEHDLKNIPHDRPVFIFAHDPPDVSARHFTNPNGDHTITREDRFENVLTEVYADGPKSDGPALTEQRAFVAFLQAHKNIIAYFHGHENWCQFYTWAGPDGDIALKTFRVDSPMKGKLSGKDETRLSFLCAVIDPSVRKMTVRECLWNTLVEAGASPVAVAWGESVTIDLSPRK